MPATPQSTTRTLNLTSSIDFLVRNISLVPVSEDRATPATAVKSSNGLDFILQRTDLITDVFDGFLEAKDALIEIRGFEEEDELIKR